MSQDFDEIVAVEDQYEEARPMSTDNSKSHQSSYTSLIQHEMIEMNPADESSYDKLGSKPLQQQDYGKSLAGMRCLIKGGFGLLVVLLLLLLVVGITSVTLVSHFASAEEPKAVTTSVVSTEAPYTQRSFMYLASTEDIGSNCISTFYRVNGNILVGTVDGVKLVNRKNLAVTSYNTSFKLVTSIVEHHDVIYLLHEEGNVVKVELCLPEMKNCQTLLEFNNTHRYISTMAVSSRYIVVMNPDGNKLIIYDFISKQSKIKQLPWLHRLSFLPDGHLLARDASAIKKYKLEDGELTELWYCPGLTNLRAMVADTDGFIYGLAYRENSVYVISTDGELLQTIPSVSLPSEIGHASIRGDEIAVPGWDDKKLHLFRVNK